jgi:hypothetical protein
VQCSAVQRSAVLYSAVQYSTLQCSAVQYSTVQSSAVQYSTVQYSTVQYSTAYSAVQSNSAPTSAHALAIADCMDPGFSSNFLPSSEKLTAKPLTALSSFTSSPLALKCRVGWKQSSVSVNVNAQHNR